MGIKKIEYYIVECDDCGCSLEDYAGPLYGLSTSEDKAKEFAKAYDWFYMGRDTWLCEDCKKAKGIL